MSLFKVVTGHNNAETLVLMTVQPTAPLSFEYPELRFSADGSIAPHGTAFYDLAWPVIKRASRPTLLTQFGLSDTVRSGLVTVALLTNANTYANYNATAFLLEPGTRAPGRWENIVIRLLTPTVIT